MRSNKVARNRQSAMQVRNLLWSATMMVASVQAAPNLRRVRETSLNKKARKFLIGQNSESQILDSTERLESLFSESLEAMFQQEALSMGKEEPTAAPVNTPGPVPMPVEVPTTAAPVEGPTSAAPVEIPLPTASPVEIARPTSFPTQTPTNLSAAEVPTTPPIATTTPPIAPTPTSLPTQSLPSSPTLAPTVSPKDSPTPAPTGSPTGSPTVALTGSPSGSPTIAPTDGPSPMPTMMPTLTCNLSESVRALLIRIVLNAVSNFDSFQDENSPQATAVEWLLGNDMEYLCPGSPTLIQRYSLAVFYFSTNGNRWSQCAAPDIFSDAAIELANEACLAEPIADTGSNAWLTPGSECLWGGVVCNSEGFVQRIDIEQNGLTGSLPRELEQLTSMTHMLLEDGLISGEIPSEFGNLVELQVLDLNFNSISGSIPDELYGLVKLQQLDLNDNRLEGTISTRIGLLSQLAFFQVHGNNMTGTIPSEMGNLSMLGAATFEANNLQGSMPAGICALRSRELETLTVDCLTVSGRGSPPFVSCPSDCCTQCF
jgi:hypothetical protein